MTILLTHQVLATGKREGREFARGLHLISVEEMRDVITK